MRAPLLDLALLPLALLASAAVAQDLPPDLPKGAGPRGTSGEVQDDAVGYAGVLPNAEGARVAVLHRSLPAGSFVEITALYSGRTIAALVAGPQRGPGIVALTPEAAKALGVGDGAAVRVRSVVPPPQEQAALRAGQAASARLDAPPTLLIALRRKLPVESVAHRHATVAAPAVAAPRPPAARPAPAARGQYGVQVATLSAADRAEALARQLSGHVVAAGGRYRVQLGPFADAASAARARADAARAGFGDARVFHF